MFQVNLNNIIKNMKNNWSSKEPSDLIAKYKKIGLSKDLALRVYSTQLLGREKN